jgi:hypothetical protein
MEFESGYTEKRKHPGVEWFSFDRCWWVLEK